MGANFSSSYENMVKQLWMRYICRSEFKDLLKIENTELCVKTSSISFNSFLTLAMLCRNNLFHFILEREQKMYWQKIKFLWVRNGFGSADKCIWSPSKVAANHWIFRDGKSGWTREQNEENIWLAEKVVEPFIAAKLRARARCVVNSSHFHSTASCMLVGGKGNQIDQSTILMVLPASLPSHPDYFIVCAIDNNLCGPQLIREA